MVVGINAVDDGWRTSLREVFGVETILYNGATNEVRKLDKQFEAEGLPDFLFCTYETIQKLVDRIPEGYYDHIIIDEIHLVSHQDSNRYIAVKALVDKHPEAAIQGLSGTPVQDKVLDLHGPVSLLDPYKAGSAEAWKNKYQKVIKSIKKRFQLKSKSGKPLWKDGAPVMREIEIPIIVETQNLDHLHERLKSLMYRVRRDDHVNFKDNVKTVTVPITQRQRRVYNSLKDEILTELNNRTITIQNAAVRLLRTPSGM